MKFTKRKKQSEDIVGVAGDGFAVVITGRFKTCSAFSKTSMLI